MKLRQPDVIREKLAKHGGWLTVKEMAKGMRLAPNTVGSALRGEPVRPDTIRTIASTLGEEPTAIATFVN